MQILSSFDDKKVLDEEEEAEILKELEMVTLNFFDRSFRWATLKKECVGRVMPPLMRELVHDLGIASPILQRIVFTSALRHIWESLQNPNPQAQERFEAQALAIMDANQTDFYSQQNSGPAHIPDVEKKLRTDWLTMNSLRLKIR